jgi:hypothetical protein
MLYFFSVGKGTKNVAVLQRGNDVMAKNVTLSVNNVAINLDYFVSKYIESVVGGILASLHDTGEIDTLKLTIDNEGQVSITLNNSDVPLKYFPIDIIRSTVLGMITPLKGVESIEDINALEINIS